MKKTLFFAAIAAALVMFTSCESDDNLGKQTTEHIVFTASLPTFGSGTTPVSHIKTTIINTDANDPDGGKVSWEQTDQVTITDGTNTAIYGVDTYSGSSATLQYVSGDQLATSGVTYTATYGVAPGTEQTYSSTVTKLPMTATSNTTSLDFTITCGVLQLQLTEADESVKSIAVSDGTTTYTLTCETPQSIDGGKDFFIALPAGKYTRFTIINNQGLPCIFSNATGVTIEANVIQPLTFSSLTFANKGTLDGHDWVQLWEGGSIWATCNVGASSPEEYGGYYAWGETAEKDNYEWDTYKWCGGTDRTLTKYCYTKTYGTIDKKIVLDLEDDAAYVNLSTNWRMPTSEEWEELVDNCTWTWTDDYNSTGVAGYIVTSDVTGYTDNSIFLPAAGTREGEDLAADAEIGYYWSSSLLKSRSNCAYYLAFISDEMNVDSSNRYSGLTVRPVLAL